MGGWKGAVDRYFDVSARGSTIGREIKSGVVTFLTLSYILLVNPQILGAAGLPVQAVVTATALSSMVACLLCGLMANLPVGVSPGMGLNAFLVFSQVLGLGVSVNKALAGCLVAAVIVAVLASVRALSAILSVVPDSIKLAVVVGMGLLLTFIGLQTAKVVVADAATMVTMGPLLRLEPLLAITGLAAIAALHYRNVKGSIIIGVLLTATAYFAAKSSWPTRFVALPQLEVFHLDFSDLLPAPGTHAFNPAAWSAVLAYTLVMVFDIGGAMFGLGNLAGLVQGGVVPGATWAYLSAAAGTAIGALTGTTPLIIAAESAVGIKEGGRTGLVAVTVAACFAASMLLAPLFQSIPQLATSPVLVLVGAMMMGEVSHIDWSSMLTAVPAFLTIVIQPFTFSIANGIYAGLAMSVLLYILTGQFLVDSGWCGGAGGGGDGGFGEGKEAVNGDVEGLEGLEPLLLSGGGGGGDAGSIHGSNGGGDVEQAGAGGAGAGAAAAAAAGQQQQHGQHGQHGRPSLEGGSVSSAGRGIPISPPGTARRRPYPTAVFSLPGSVGAGHHGASYERQSFTMLINTFGSSLTRFPPHSRGGAATPSRSSAAHGSEHSFGGSDFHMDH